MDTILIANESLKHLSDSVHVLMPDSIHTWQQVVTEKPDYSKYISIVCSLIIAIGGYMWVAYKERIKEFEKSQDIGDHILTWIHINKLQCIRFGVDCEDMIQEIEHSNQNQTIQPIVDYKFYFEQILEINKVALTKFFIPKNKSGEKNYEKLYVVTNMNNEILNDLQNEKAFFKENYPTWVLSVSEFIANADELYEHLEGIPGTDDVLDKIYMIKSGVIHYGNPVSLHNFFTELVNIVNLSEHSNAVYRASNFALYKSQTIVLIDLANSFLITYGDLKNSFYERARMLDLIEKYYKGIITEKEYQYEKDFEKINPKVLRMMLTVG